MARDSIILVQEEPRGPSQLIEVPVNTNGRNAVPFPDIQQLRSDITQRIVIKQLRLIPANVLTNGPLTGAVNAPLAELQKISLILYCEGWEKAKWMPILTLNDMTVPGGTFPHRYHATRFNNWEKVDWTKSTLVYSNGTASANTPYVVLLDALYIKLDANGDEIIGPS
jgi:hypothetical protein